MTLALASVLLATTRASAQEQPGPERERAPQATLGQIANGDFALTIDGEPAGWNSFGPAATVEDGGARVTAGARGLNWIAQTVPIEAGAAYEVRAAASGDARAIVRVSWHATGDGSGEAIGFVDSAPADARRHRDGRIRRARVGAQPARASRRRGRAGHERRLRQRRDVAGDRTRVRRP